MVSLEGQNQSTDQLAPTEPKVSDGQLSAAREILKNHTLWTYKNQKAALEKLGVDASSLRGKEITEKLAEFDIVKPEKRRAKELKAVAEDTINKVENAVAIEVAETKAAISTDASADEKAGLVKIAAEVTTAGSDASQQIEEVNVAAAGKTDWLDEFVNADIDRDAGGEIIIDDEMATRVIENLGRQNNPDNAVEAARLGLEKKAREVEDEAEAWFLDLDNINEADEKLLLQKITTLRTAVAESKLDADIQKAIEEVQKFQREFKGSVPAVIVKPEVVPTPAVGVNQVVSQDDINSILAEVENRPLKKRDRDDGTDELLADAGGSGPDLGEILKEPSTKSEGGKEDAERAELIDKIKDNDEVIQGIANLVKEGVPKAEVPKAVTLEEIKEKLTYLLKRSDLTSRQKADIRYRRRRLTEIKEGTNQKDVQQKVEEVASWLKVQGLNVISDPVVSSQVDDSAINQPTPATELESVEELPNPAEKLAELQEKSAILRNYLFGLNVGDVASREDQELRDYRSKLFGAALGNNEPLETQELLAETERWLKRVQPGVDHEAALLDIELLEKTRAYVEECQQENKQPTTAGLQRRLKISYNKANRLLENFELDLVELEAPIVHQQEIHTDSEFEAQIEGVIRQCDFIDIHPEEIIWEFKTEDWENIRTILTNKKLDKDARLTEVKKIIQPHLADILERNKVATDQDQVAEMVFEALSQHIEAEVTRQVAKFDLDMARNVTISAGITMAKAVLISKAVAASATALGLATVASPIVLTAGIALTTGAVLGGWMWTGKKTKIGKYLTQKFNQVSNHKLWGKSSSERAEKKRDTAEQGALAELSDEKLAALVSNTLRRVSSEKWQTVEKNDADIETKLKNNPEDFKLWQEQSANMIEAQKLFFGQSLLELQEGEYAKEPAETRLHMALQKTITAGMYVRTEQHQKAAMDRLKEDDPAKFKWLAEGLKKYGQITKGEIEGWQGAIATVGLGAATVYAIRETGWGRMAAGAIGGAMFGLSLAERQQKKTELKMWQEVDKIIKEGESKIIDITYPADVARLEYLQADAQTVEAQWQMGMFKDNPLLLQRAENFIYHVKKLVAENVYADQLLNRVNEHTEAVKMQAAEQSDKLKKAMKQSRGTQILQVVGAAAGGMALGYAGMRFSELQMENNLGGVLEQMPEPVQHQILSQLGLKGENIHDLTRDQLSQVFSGGKLSHGFAEMADKAYQDYLVNEQGFKPNDFVAFSSDPGERLAQLKLLEQNHGKGLSNEQLVGKVLAVSAEHAKATPAHAANLEHNKSQAAEPQGKVVADSEVKLAQEVANKTTEQINAFSDNPTVRQELAQSLAGNPDSLEQLQAAATAKTGLDGLSYHNGPLADHLMREVDGNPEKFVQRVAWMEQVLGGPLAEHKLELENLINKASHDGGADLEAVLNANQVMEVKAGDTLTKLLHQQFDVKNGEPSDLTKNFVNKYSGVEVGDSKEVTQSLIDKAIGRAGVMQENLLHSGNKLIVTNSGSIETIKGVAALDSERVSEAALRTNYLTSILGVPKESISDVQVGSGRSFEFSSHGHELHISNAGTGHPEVTVDVDGEPVKLNLDHSGQVVGADGVDLAEVKSLDNFVQQGPESFVGKTVDANGQIEVNGTKFDFGENAHVRVHGISNEHIAETLPKGQTLPADAKFFSIRDLGHNTNTAQVRLGGNAVLETPLDKLSADGLRTGLAHQAQYLQAARESIVSTYKMDQQNAAELLAVARRADGSVHTLLTETPNQPPATIQRIMESVGNKHEMLQRNGHFNVERIKLVSTLTDEAHKFTPQETQSALEITRDTRLNDSTNLKLAEAAILHKPELMKEVLGAQTEVGAIAVKGDTVVINAGTKEFPVSIGIKGSAAVLDLPGKDVYLGTTDQQLKGIGRIIAAGVEDKPGGSQAAAEDVLNGVWHGDKSFVHRLTGQEYNAKIEESPKTLVDLIANNAAGKEYAGQAAKSDLFNQIELDKNAHQLQFDVNKGAIDARYNIDQRSGVILRENEILTERQFAERLKADIAAARKHVGE